ncbi:J domain-containing protein [Falsiroseomonas sp.]|uniref:J domain-containing protein n=1 Tax=Falsiroseomonas sp. TaxID=2870721 RepID=UPI0027325F54|nr:J domain-containing protein [Falsiroseomonas sp.]MDP3415791.1 J domain-containing protein [Falsiroseomonas sp.]
MTAELEAPVRPCESPGCPEPGAFRAPRDRKSLNEYRWFCLEHVRAYNRAWDYYKGMSPGEIERHLREDTGWQRPTWPLGRLGGANPFDPEVLRDPLGVLGATPLHAQRRAKAPRPDEPPPELRAALDVLGLVWPVDSLALRSRYKELAKRYHPDANGGDRQAEERLKDINRAYSLVRRKLPGKATPAPAPAG